MKQHASYVIHEERLGNILENRETGSPPGLHVHDMVSMYACTYACMDTCTQYIRTWTVYMYMYKYMYMYYNYYYMYVMKRFLKGRGGEVMFKVKAPLPFKHTNRHIWYYISHFLLSPHTLLPCLLSSHRCCFVLATSSAVLATVERLFNGEEKGAQSDIHCTCRHT